MSSRVVRLPLLLLLSALAAAHVRPGGAEGDPLPPDMVDAMWNSLVSSPDDLQVAGEDVQEGEGGETHASDVHRGRFTRSLIEPERALIAECKVRTEVQEVTRDMHDRRNANFLLWPLCVEVQRCSGCCNSHSMQCVPVVTSTRYLKVKKIQYVNFKSEVGDVVVSVEDHVTCRCQSRAPRPPAAPQPPPVHPPVTPPKTPTSKAELHRHDEQKHNQQPVRAGLWPPGGYTQLVRWTPGPVGPRPPPAYTLAAGANAAVTPGARAEGPHGAQDVGAPQGSGSEGGARAGAGAGHQQPLLPRHPHHPHHHHPHPPQVSPQPSLLYRLNSFQADSASTPAGGNAQPANHEPASDPSPSAAAANQKEPSLDAARGEHVGVHQDRQTETASANRSRASEQEESGSTNSGEGAVLPAGPGRDQGSGRTGGGAEEPRQPHPPQPHPDDRLRPQPTASHTGVSLQGGPGRTPASGGRTSKRPATQRRRRKHRNRISKNAIRAIIM